MSDEERNLRTELAVVQAKLRIFWRRAEVIGRKGDVYFGAGMANRIMLDDYAPLEEKELELLSVIRERYGYARVEI